jgi:hypothetical protein
MILRFDHSKASRVSSDSIFYVQELVSGQWQTRESAFLLTFFSVYDWLSLTGRLCHRACLVLVLGVAVAFARWCGKRENTFPKFRKKTTL